MIRRSPSLNQRRRQKPKNLLEVNIRAEIGNRQRNKRVALIAAKLFLVFALVGGTLYGVRKGLRHFFLENPDYNIAVVEINNPTGSIDRDSILTASGINLGDNIFRVSLSDAQESLTDLPQVATVELRRVLPNKITIDLTERRPIAWLAEPGTEDPASSPTAYLIDPKGTLFKPKRMMDLYLHLPILYGVPPQNYLPGDVVAHPDLAVALQLLQRNAERGRLRVRTVDLSNGYSIVVTDTKGRKISFPLEDTEHQLERLAAVLEATSNRGMEVQTINLLVEKHVPVTLVNNVIDGDGKGESGSVGAEPRGEGESNAVPAPASTASAASAKSEAAAPKKSERKPQRTAASSRSERKAASSKKSGEKTVRKNPFLQSTQNRQ